MLTAQVETRFRLPSHPWSCAGSASGVHKTHIKQVSGAVVSRPGPVAAAALELEAAARAGVNPSAADCPRDIANSKRFDNMPKTAHKGYFRL